MRIGILGSGLMGGKLGTVFARAGHDVVFSYARSNAKLKKLAREAQRNARAGTPAPTLVGSACAARWNVGGALFAVGAAALALLFIGIHNAWDAVTYHVFVGKQGQRQAERRD